MLRLLDKRGLLCQDLSLMTTKNHTLFISDLHLDANDSPATNTFFYFLDHIAPAADALYILGDFFESYIGDDHKTPFSQLIICALSKLADKNLPIFLMHGNRDFLIGKKFAERAGVTLIPDPYCVTLYNQKILLLHGDSLCTKDKGHQRFRRITRNWLVQKIFLSLPLSFRQRFANELRDKSMENNKMKSAEIMDVSDEAVSDALKKYPVAKMIHGHTHRPMISDTRIVLDAWHEHGNYLRMDCDGNMELVDIQY